MIPDLGKIAVTVTVRVDTADGLYLEFPVSLFEAPQAMEAAAKGGVWVTHGGETVWRQSVKVTCSHELEPDQVPQMGLNVRQPSASGQSFPPNGEPS